MPDVIGGRFLYEPNKNRYYLTLHNEPLRALYNEPLMALNNEPLRALHNEPLRAHERNM